MDKRAAAALKTDLTRPVEPPPLPPPAAARPPYLAAAAARRPLRNSPALTLDFMCGWSTHEQPRGGLAAVHTQPGAEQMLAAREGGRGGPGQGGEN